MSDPPPIIVYSVCAMHAVQAAMLLATNEATGAIGPASLLAVFGSRYAVAALLLGCAALALRGVTINGVLKIWFLLPQQVLLSIPVMGATIAAAHGSYADGVLRSPFFILTDQLPLIALGLGHLASVIYRTRSL